MLAKNHKQPRMTTLFFLKYRTKRKPITMKTIYTIIPVVIILAGKVPPMGPSGYGTIGSCGLNRKNRET